MKKLLYSLLAFPFLAWGDVTLQVIDPASPSGLIQKVDDNFDALKVFTETNEDNIALNLPLSGGTMTGPVVYDLDTGITAATPGGQGDGATSAEKVNVTVVGTDLDGVTALALSKGSHQVIWNNDATGSNTLEVWPVSGDNIGGGTDTAVVLETGEFIVIDGISASEAVSTVGELEMESVTFTILEPDLVQPVTDEVLLKFFAAEKYPSGVTMVSWHVGASAVMTDVLNLLESASPTASTPTTMESITLTAASSGEDDGAFTDGDVAADGYVFLDFNATVPDNVAQLSVTLTYIVN